MVWMKGNLSRIGDNPISKLILGGVEFELLRVDGDPNGEELPTRILLEKDGITAEYIRGELVDRNNKIVKPKYVWGKVNLK